ncbi:heptosyltransferase [Deltaproteobacteria bacterium]|nr:heptosyltransferase [Deltaproteobacteria bacterium]
MENIGKYKKIGVWNTAFLGDAILTLPLLQTLRNAYPQAEIDFWVRKGAGSLFASHPALNHVYEYDKRGADKGFVHLCRLGRALRRARYNLWIGAHASIRSALLACLGGAQMRIGYSAPLCNALFYTHRVPRRFAELEEIERLHQLLSPLALPEQVLSSWPEIVLPGEAHNAAKQFWEQIGANGDVPVMGIHPGSTWGTKRWPAEFFADIAARAANEGVRVLLFADSGETALAKKVENLAWEKMPPAARENIFNLAGKLSLTVLAAYLGRLTVYLTNDSGPMHLAWAQKTPVTALFGPTARRLGFYPRGETATVMELPLPCRPCGLHGPQTCPLGSHECMRGISPEAVWSDVEKKLSGSRTKNAPQSA